MLAAGGQCLFLEHGRAKYEWLNNMLDRGSCKHEDKWGCTWNRDILGIVQRSEIPIESCWRFHFGTTYVIWCKKPEEKHNTRAAKSAAKQVVLTDTELAQPVKATGDSKSILMIAHDQKSN